MSTVFQYAQNIIVAGGNQYMTSQDYALYERGTLGALLEIMKFNWTGYGIIQLISEMSGKEVIITPNYSKSCLASAGMPTWKGPNQVEIIYSPIPFGKAGCASPGFTADEVLLHELVHAYRQLKRGIKTPDSIAVPNFNYQDREEFIAILLTNIYSSKKNRLLLRKDHGTDPLPAKFAGSEYFLKREPAHIKPISKLLTEDNYLCMTFVSRDEGIFNPVDYFIKNKALCISLIPGPLVAD